MPTQVRFMASYERLTVIISYYDIINLNQSLNKLQKINKLATA
jgi:hypothetical protein